jgi:hypothetical protein
MEPPRWKIITPSQYEWERRGLDFIRSGLPNHDPYRAWANFEFQTPDGAIYEIDLLVLTKKGFWLVEIKSWPGRLGGDVGTWTRTRDGRTIPYCETDSDSSLVVGWAGWNHLQQATAIVAYYDARKREGWDAKRLTPLLAGLDQLLPWIHQWHPEVDPEFGETAGQSFQTMLESDAHELGLTIEDIRAWEPPKRRQPRKARNTRKRGTSGEEKQ